MSRLPYELLLALRYLRPKRTFVSAITLIATVGVMLGVAVLIVVIAVMTGFSHDLREALLSAKAHLRIEGTEGALAEYEPVMQAAAGRPHVRGVAPFVLGPILLEHRGADGAQKVWAPFVRGLDPEHAADVGRLLTRVTAGTNALRGAGLLLGRELAYNLRVRPGDTVNILPPSLVAKMARDRGTNGGPEEAYLPTEFEVRGVFDTGFYEYDATVVVVSLRRAQELYGLGDDVHGLLVMLDDPFLAEPVRRDLLQQLGPGFRITTWMEENSHLLDAVAVEKNVMFIVLFFIMIVAAFGITSTLITFVVQKTREIGILKALGATRWQVSVLFLGQSLAVGVIGVVLGLGLGLLAVRFRNEFLAFMRRTTGLELFPAEIYGFRELPALVEPRDVLLICGSALVACLVAGVLPAWHAGRLQPVEALRHE
ncbi:MAG: ABC transporter permease [Limisphaerales bacterium]